MEPRWLLLLSAAHLAREPVIDQPDYFPAPIIITGCNRSDPLSIAPSLCLFFQPLLFFSLIRDVYVYVVWSSRSMALLLFPYFCQFFFS